MKTYRFAVHGKVQGVSYRAYAQKKARELGVEGWVMNTEDGKVIGEITGPDEQVNEFLDWLWKGSPFGRTEQVDSYEIGLKKFSGFEIKR